MSLRIYVYPSSSRNVRLCAARSRAAARKAFGPETRLATTDELSAVIVDVMNVPLVGHSGRHCAIAADFIGARAVVRS